MHNSLVRRCLSPVALLGVLLLASSATAQTTWNESVAKAFEEARTSGRPVVVFVATDWCHYCKLMQSQTWSHPTISKTVKQDFIPLKLDGDRDQSIVKELGLQGYPATLVYTPSGQQLAKKGGFMPAGETYQWLAQAKQRWQVAATTPATTTPVTTTSRTR